MRLLRVYDMATISRLLEILGLFRKRALQMRPIFCNETFNFKESTSYIECECLFECECACVRVCACVFVCVRARSFVCVCARVGTYNACVCVHIDI